MATTADNNSSNNNGDEVPQAVRLPDPPTDGITRMQFLGTSSLLASSSWDGSLRIHETGCFNNDDAAAAAKLQVSHSHNVGPLLGLACEGSSGGGGGTFEEGESVTTTTLYTGALDGSVHAFDTTTSISTLIGKHKTPSGSGGSSSATAAACSCVALLPPLVVTAGWDRRLYLWDVRQNNNAAMTLDLPGKAFSMDVDAVHSRVAVACSGRQTCLIDVRRPPSSSSSNNSSTAVAEIAVRGESSQKHQTRCLRFFPDGQRIAVGSVEGRVAVEWVDGRPLEKGNSNNGNNDDATATVSAGIMPKEYAFKCHRRNDLVFPVNCIEFHPVFGTFATGGGDGTVVTWDGFNRKRLTALPAFGTSVAALAFSHDGKALAMASSYTFEEGERDHPRDEIFVRRMLDSDCQPKKKTAS